MAIGGFNDNGGRLSLAQFIRYVRARRDPLLTSPAAASAGPGRARRAGTSTIESWVQSHYTPRRPRIAGATVYDLTK